MIEYRNRALTHGSKRTCIPLGLPVNGGFRGCLPLSAFVGTRLIASCHSIEAVHHRDAINRVPTNVIVQQPALGRTSARLSARRGLQPVTPSLCRVLLRLLFPILAFPPTCSGYSMPDFGQIVYSYFSGFCPTTISICPSLLHKRRSASLFIKGTWAASRSYPISSSCSRR